MLGVCFTIGLHAGKIHSILSLIHIVEKEFSLNSKFLDYPSLVQKMDCHAPYLSIPYIPLPLLMAITPGQCFHWACIYSLLKLVKKRTVLTASTRVMQAVVGL